MVLQGRNPAQNPGLTESQKPLILEHDNYRNWSRFWGSLRVNTEDLTKAVSEYLTDNYEFSPTIGFDSNSFTLKLFMLCVMKSKLDEYSDLQIAPTANVVEKLNEHMNDLSNSLTGGIK